ncbi:hypothetical protein BC826DRAFT_1026282 [Russula brevipes]|nr:hypothetical protein BC826DRAFT_1026282 [Russula brevipes]
MESMCSQAECPMGPYSYSDPGLHQGCLGLNYSGTEGGKNLHHRREEKSTAPGCSSRDRILRRRSVLQSCPRFSVRRQTVLQLPEWTSNRSWTAGHYAAVPALTTALPQPKSWSHVLRHFRLDYTPLRQGHENYGHRRSSRAAGAGNLHPCCSCCTGR